MKINYINPTDESAKQLFSKPIKGEVVMLNLLRFKEIADYHHFPEIAPEKPITGKEAFQLYINHTLSFLKNSGGEVIMLGECEHFFIGPTDERWDLMMLIKQSSLDSFLSFATEPEYLKVIGHREAALLDSRLLPIKPLSAR